MTHSSSPSSNQGVSAIGQNKHWVWIQEALGHFHSKFQVRITCQLWLDIKQCCIIELDHVLGLAHAVFSTYIIHIIQLDLVLGLALIYSHLSMTLSIRTEGSRCPRSLTLHLVLHLVLALFRPRLLSTWSIQ